MQASSMARRAVTSSVTNKLRVVFYSVTKHIEQNNRNTRENLVPSRARSHKITNVRDNIGGFRPAKVAPKITYLKLPRVRRSAGSLRLQLHATVGEAVPGDAASNHASETPHYMTSPHSLRASQTIPSHRGQLKTRRLRQANITPTSLRDQDPSPRGSKHNGRTEIAARDRQGPVIAKWQTLLEMC